VASDLHFTHLKKEPPSTRRRGFSSARRGSRVDLTESMSAFPTTSAASRLCQACGLCCNGVMFHTVRLQPNDVPSELAALGLKLKRKRGQNWLLQPCPAHCDGQCSIYAQRPARCRLFECRQLQRVGTGEITEAMALEKIQDVQRRVAQLDGLSRRTDGSLRRGPLSKRCETALAEPFDATTHPELLRERETLARDLAELDAILDEHFRAQG